MKPWKPLAFALLCSPLSSYGAAFSSCPTQAFLVQQNVAQLFGVNLATGYYQTLSEDMGTTGKLNAIGFNLHDDYLYAWSYQHKTLARIGNDYQVEPLTLDWNGFASDVSFYVGDVAVENNAHYLYRSGSAYGLFRVSLDSADADYLSMQRVIDGSALNLRIFDMAFHPDNGMLYSVDNQGRLWRINPETGASENLANVGQVGTFGAVYFDVSGHLYISRNSDGLVFQIDIASNSPEAQLYAQGPASSNNDGARCAIAPIVAADDANIDFGDAPDSFGTSLINNGARHQLVDGGIQLGSNVDGEADAYVYPASDDSSRLFDDEDGIAFVTDVQVGLDFVIQVDSSANGFLSAWFDLNGNGTFDNEEQLLTDQAVVEGVQSLLVSVPEGYESGDRWARFRISSGGGNTATGGAPDGEVEDYQIYVGDSATQVSYYPSADGYATVAFEDNWPAAGDYDLNDLVVNLQTKVLSFANGDVARIELQGEVRAVGASFHNGFAIRIPGIDKSLVDVAAIRYEINGELLQASVLDENTNDITAIIAADVREYINNQNQCDFYKTQADCRGTGQLHFKVLLPMHEGLAKNTLPSAPFDPFIYATEHSRNPYFASSPGRGLEIHSKNQSPSAAVDSSLWGSFDDVSNPSASSYYQTGNGLPWAIIVPYNWQYPFERISVADAYPKFLEYAQSEGQQSSDWYLLENARGELIYQD
ncbi:LruC domain-containing protein [Agarivorans sp. 1_MG-2023]|uniref:LruC domain-containing protein n=1 Tax=Agarivorans sp. 1_MG-2023 TaxID=3062634 RepID=UPI0026E25351|nr:LruC domain-containing protein [Agarivorans sp. 1_MG-2023]MDO6761917.1 LruC domain-containing protein [Agarivorans sp. 1_MG-2023]